MAENLHANHILHQSLVPARITETTRTEGEELAKSLADQLEVVGLIAVEPFSTRMDRFCQ